MIDFDSEAAALALGGRIVDDSEPWEIRARHDALIRVARENERIKRRERAAEARRQRREALSLIAEAERAGRPVKRLAIDGAVLEFGKPTVAPEAQAPAACEDLTEWEVALGTFAPS
jgi:hypothetical protein